MDTLKRASRNPFFASMLIALFAVSCTDNVGIFASLAQEEPNDLYATEALGSVSPATLIRFGDSFYMASGSIYRRGLARSANAWSALQPSAMTGLPAAAVRCTQIATDGARIYAAWLDSDFANQGLYASSDGSAWTAISSLASDAATQREICSLYSVNGTVFVSVKQTASESAATVRRFKLYYLSGDAAVECGYASDLVYDSEKPYDFTPIRSMTYGDGAYWFVSGSSLFSSAGVAGPYSALTGETGMPTGKSLTSVLWSPDLNRLLVATGSGVFDESGTMTGRTSGYLYARLPGGSWECSAASILVSSSSGGYANFTDLQVVRDNSSASGSPIVVASAAASIKYGDGTAQDQKTASARGYGILVPSSSSLSGVSLSSTTTSQALLGGWSSYEISLMTYAVNKLFCLDGESGTKVLFACTAGKGLWTNIRGSDGSWGGWEKE